MIRISKYLADCGILSRRKSEDLVKSGQVKINGEVVTDLFAKIEPGKDIVELNNKSIDFKEKTVIALNKPEGYVCTVSDELNRKTVLDLIDISLRDLRIYPVGRLDFNSRGLLILTNNGDLAYKITHPKFNIKKQYEIILDKNIKDKDIENIENGIEIDGRKVSVQSLDLKYSNNSQIIAITIHEGRKRILRQLFSKLGYNVKSLKRVKIGSYRLGNIREGNWKKLSEKEILQLLEND